ncbi:MAG: T9SS type A sorting domain-containing protein [Bacteroidales bacterium]|nr:T9SS type A sorting domain-containing protein [Bacteroidales bacterium]
MIHLHKVRVSFLLIFCFFTLLTGTLFAQPPAGYYNNAEGLKGQELQLALYNIIKGHTSRTYGDLWTDFQSTDKTQNGKVWDMYSDVPGGTPAYEYTFGSDQCGNYNGEGDCYNREHSWPKSWFNDATPMYTELFHLVPTDGYVNGKRSNYPFGEVGNASWTSTNGSKVGSCDFPGYSGTVFEPIDEYKGDFARGYFYMATRYQNVIAGWENYDSNGDAVMNGTSYPAFEVWTVNLLLAWHTSDPVSAKEIARNNAVYGIQHNRNPYIDHPEYAAYVWDPNVGTDELSIMQAKLTVWPVPAKTKVNFMLENYKTDGIYKVTITDISGRELSEQQIETDASNVIENFENLHSGFYLLIVTDKGKTIASAKLMKN